LRIEFIDRDSINSTCLPIADASTPTKKYILSLIKNGPGWYVDNVQAQMMALVVDDSLIPLVIAEKNSNDSDVCSVNSHYVKYTIEELRKDKDRFSRVLLTLCVWGVALILKFARADKVVYVNNWLFATNPCPQLSPIQIGEITTALKKKFPDHALIFRSINTHLYRDFFHALREKGYRMVRSRRIYIVDPTSRKYLKNKNVKRDRKLLEDGPYEIVDTDQLTEADVPRITELYRKLYLKKHSFLNPQLNEQFFLLTLQEKILSFKALKRNGRIDAFVCHYFREEIMTGTFIGYDTQMPIESNLLRQAFSLEMAVAEEKSMMLHLSAGVGEFKRFRSALPCTEFDAVYDAHLPLRRRFAWGFLEFSLGCWQHLAILLANNHRAVKTGLRAVTGRFVDFHLRTKYCTSYRLFGKALWHNPVKGGLNFLRVGKAALRRTLPASPSFMPHKISVEVTNRCNLKCSTCILGSNRAYQNYSPRKMRFEEFRHILKQIPTLIHVTMNGYGEPLLNPDLIPMLELANRQGMTTSFITNGILLDRQKTEELLDVGLTELGVSIHSLGKDSFARFRSGASLDRVLANVEGLISARRERGLVHPTVAAWSILMRDSVDSAADLVRSASDIGIDKINFLDYITGMGDEKSDRQKIEKSIYDSVIIDLKRIGNEQGVFVSGNLNPSIERGVCNQPWMTPFISAEGFVMPCSFIADPGLLNFGNIFESDFRSIWLGPHYTAFRRNFGITRPSVCRDCPCY
jgi:MoaA/NifB/PqqE/SkfB family radical SAM enzyme